MSTSSDSSWLQFGGNAERQHATSIALIPPLRQIWDFDPSAGFGPFSAIAVDSVIFSGTLQGEIYAIHAGTGKKLGSADFGSAVAGAPALGGSLLFIPLATGEEGVIAYDLAQGTTVWRGMTGPVESAPLVLGDNLLVASLAGEVVCFRASSGERCWTFKLPDRNRPSFIRSSPSASDSVVVFGGDDGFVYGLNLESGALRWSVKTGGCVTGTPAVSNGIAYAGSEDGFMYAISLDSGNTIWRQNLGAPVFTSPSIGTGRLFVGTASGSVIGLNRIDGTVEWTFQTKSVVTAPPLLSGTTLYIGSLDRTLYALDIQSGRSLWSLALESRIRTAPIPVHGCLIIQLENRSIIALTPEASSR